MHSLIYPDFTTRWLGALKIIVDGTVKWITYGVPYYLWPCISNIQDLPVFIFSRVCHGATEDDHS